MKVEGVDMDLFDQVVLVKEFRSYVSMSGLSGYQIRKLFKLTVEDLVELLKLKDDGAEIDLLHVQHLFRLYQKFPKLIPYLPTYEEDALDHDSLVMQIPATRPVRGGDVTKWRTIHQLTVDQARSYYRMSPNSYATMTGKAALAAVLNPTIALLTRAWSQNPLLVPHERDWTFEELCKIIPDTARNCGIALGKQQSSATRWGHDVSMTPVAKVCANVMVQMTIDRSYDHWLEFVNQEALSRGVENVFAKGHWNKEQIKDDHQNQVKKLNR
ncbi:MULTISPECIES: hypothetical protein [Aeromonas]|uniref:Uncharacterized protein n=1 Tax=Aeromonas veronii TaxID=654 RepID=A0A4V3YZQ6_AERVE|nr:MULTISPECIES: hypothetical protein [Aeromonas]THJ43642.1 hypothetical protein E8Q35_15155 [Aeromonas veronii]